MPINDQQVIPTNQEASGKAYVDYGRRYVINAAGSSGSPATSFDSDSKFYIPINAGEFVKEIRTFTKVAFVSGTITIGDSSGSATWAESTDVGALVLNRFFTTTGSAPRINRYGKYYKDADYLVVAESAASSAGQLIVTVIFDGYGTGPMRGQLKNLPVLDYVRTA